MSSWTLGDYYGNSVEIDSVDTLINTIDNFIKSSPRKNPIVVLAHPEGNTLSMGLSNEIGFLSYSTSSCNPPYPVSLGDPNLRREDGMVRFDCGEETDIPRRNCIPIDILKEVVKYYFLTGKLSSLIQWEDF